MRVRRIKLNEELLTQKVKVAYRCKPVGFSCRYAEPFVFVMEDPNAKESVLMDFTIIKSSDELPQRFINHRDCGDNLIYVGTTSLSDRDGSSVDLHLFYNPITEFMV